MSDEEQVRVAYINTLPTGTARTDYALALVAQGILSMEDSAKLLYRACKAREAAAKHYDLPPGQGPNGQEARQDGFLEIYGPLEPQKAEQPPPSLCACGAELMGKFKSYLRCGDCVAQNLPIGQVYPTVSLDQRISEAQPPKVDKDPTEGWSAGALANWEWP